MKLKRLAVFATAALAATCALTALTACDGGNGTDDTYTITQAYTSENKSDIPADAVNQVMFAYSDTNATFETKLTLNAEDSTYTLYKAIVTDKIENDSGEMDYAFKGEWEFYGTYTVSESNSNEITLKVPTSGKTNIYYPTVLNYQSIEKQTQGWVDSTERPELLTRFNKWYPSKASVTVDQPVTLDGTTLTFAEVDLELPEEEPGAGTEEPEETPGETPEEGAPTVDPEALIGAVAGGKVINLYADGTFSFRYDEYGITENGTWTWKDHVLTLTTGKGTEIVAEFNSDYNLAFTYICDASSLITEEFVLVDWGDALGVGGNYEVQA